MRATIGVTPSILAAAAGVTSYHSSPLRYLSLTCLKSRWRARLVPWAVQVGLGTATWRVKRVREGQNSGSCWLGSPLAARVLRNRCRECEKFPIPPPKKHLNCLLTWVYEYIIRATQGAVMACSQCWSPAECTVYACCVEGEQSKP